MTKIKENPNLFRDEYSGAIINNNTKEYEEYLRQKEYRKKLSGVLETVEKLEDKIQKQQEKLDLILDLLSKERK